MSFHVDEELDRMVIPRDEESTVNHERIRIIVENLYVYIVCIIWIIFMLYYYYTETFEKLCCTINKYVIIVF